MAKQARMESVDRISNMPDPILSHILSFLSTKEAVRTSILSTRWSKVFCLVSNLIFDDHGIHKKSISYCFMNFVDRVLFSRKGNVDKFHLKFRRFVDWYRVDGWMRYMLSNRVREIDLQLKLKDFDRLPLGIFSCNTLVVLKLDIDQQAMDAIEVPVKSCSPSLKILHLCGFKFSDDDSVRRLFSSCLVLEELVVKKCFLSPKFNVSSPTLKRLTITFEFTACELVIDAPSLVYLKCYCLPKSFLLKSLNSLVEAYINFRDNLRYDFHVDSYNQAANELFKGISNVQSLHLSVQFDKPYRRVCTLIGELPNVTYLNVDGHFRVKWETMILELLSCFPCLEALDIKVNYYCNISKVSPSKGFPPFVWSQLKKIQILSFKGEESEFELIEYFLKNAQVLENLTVRRYWSSNIDKRWEEFSKTYKLFSVV